MAVAGRVKRMVSLFFLEHHWATNRLLMLPRSGSSLPRSNSASTTSAKAINIPVILIAMNGPTKKKWLVSSSTNKRLKTSKLSYRVELRMATYCLRKNYRKTIRQRAVFGDRRC